MLLVGRFDTFVGADLVKAISECPTYLVLVHRRAGFVEVASSAKALRDGGGEAIKSKVITRQSEVARSFLACNNALGAEAEERFPDFIASQWRKPPES